MDSFHWSLFSGLWTLFGSGTLMYRLYSQRKSPSLQEDWEKTASVMPVVIMYTAIIVFWPIALSDLHKLLKRDDR